jgi:S-sulfo-L-cysteine synthase (3-phospho-L-serine-dependent)
VASPWFVFIESNTTGTGRLFARGARAMGYQPVMVCGDASRYPFLAEDDVPSVVADTTRPDILAACLDRLSADAPVQAIYSSSEYFIEAAAGLARQSGLPGPCPEAVQVCRHKGLQRERLAAGMAVPGFARVRTERDAVAAARRLGLPVVVKPVMGSGSVGVRLCHRESDIAEHACLLLARHTNERGLPMPGEILVEEYIAGPEYSAEMMSARIAGVTRKHLSPEPYFVETGHDFPAPIPASRASALGAAAARAVRLAGLDWGAAHVELRWGPRGPVVIEINPRLAGGFIPELVRLATGIDLIHEALALAAGAATPAPRPRDIRHAAIRFIIAPASGTIVRLANADHRREASPDVQIRWYRAIGDVVCLRHDFRDRIGHVMTCASDPHEAAAAADEALAHVIVEMNSTV